MYGIDISKEEWKEILEVLQKYNIPYTTHYDNEDKHIQIDLVIPKFYKE